VEDILFLEKLSKTNTIFLTIPQEHCLVPAGFYIPNAMLMKKLFILAILSQGFCLFSQNILFVNHNVQGGLQTGNSWSDDCTFLKNSVFVGNGGALFVTNSEYTSIIRNCLFEKDSSKFSWGGGLYYDDIGESQLIIEACNFKENYATEAASICTEKKVLSTPFFIEIIACNFENNKATIGFGGAIWLIDGGNKTIRFFNCNFLNNRSGSSATAIMVNSTVLTTTLDQCAFIGNVGITPNPNGTKYAVRQGGAKVETKITNCLFAGNESALGLFSPQNAEATYHITNCTFFLEW